MNPMGLMEMAHIKEQESMREALRRAAIREARREAGITWFQAFRARLFRQGDGVAVAPAAAPAADTTPAPAAAIAATPAGNGTPVLVHDSANGTPALVHEITIRKHTSPSASSGARAAAPAPTLHVVQAAELDCVGADC